MLKLLLAAAGIFGASKLFSAASTAKAADNLQFNPSAVKWQGFKNGAFNFNIIYKIINPVNKDINISFLFCDVFFTTGTKITSINKQNWNLKIQAEAQTSVSVPVKIYLTDLLFIGLDVIRELKAGNFPDKLKLKGYVKVNDFTVPFDETVQVI
ncbi:MAG: hypothetical protein L3J35_03700 [Bacteroidales bacterium]|nr:hypothetical protein [Bacteroidales bacterium]